MKLFREDLDQLVAFFTDTCATVTIADDVNRYETLDEMSAHAGSKLQHLDIRGERPGLHFVLNQIVEGQGNSGGKTLLNELKTEEISDGADALFLKVQDFLVGKQRPLFRVPFLAIAILGFISWMVFAGRDIATKSQTSSPGFVVSMFVFLIFAILAGTMTNYVTLKKKVESPSFWAKNQQTFASGRISHRVVA